MNEFSLKELYDVKLKATYPIEINGENYSVGETLMEFDKLSIANFQEVRSLVSARGGYGNPSLINWDELRQVAISFSQGVFSKLQWAIFMNSEISPIEPQSEILVTCREKIESNEEGKINLSHTPKGQVFFRDVNGKKITLNETDEVGTYDAAAPYREVIADYEFVYDNGGTSFTIGRRFMKGFLSLEGKTRVKDDITGQTHTGILKIPKLQLVSDLSMKLGKNAEPLVGVFNAYAYPVGARGEQVAISLVVLNDDIDSDI